MFTYVCTLSTRLGVLRVRSTPAWKWTRTSVRTWINAARRLLTEYTENSSRTLANTLQFLLPLQCRHFGKWFHHMLFWHKIPVKPGLQAQLKSTALLTILKLHISSFWHWSWGLQGVISQLSPVIPTGRLHEHERSGPMTTTPWFWHTWSPHVGSCHELYGKTYLPIQVGIYIEMWLHCLLFDESTIHHWYKDWMEHKV